MDNENSTTTRLITLLNISAVKTGKRKRPFDDSIPAQKLNKRKFLLFADNAEKPVSTIDAQIAEVEQKDVGEENEPQGMLISKYTSLKIPDEYLKAILESYERHFGTDPVVLTQSARETVDRRAWTFSKDKLGKLGSVVVASPDGVAQSSLPNNGQQLPVRQLSACPLC